MYNFPAKSLQREHTFTHRKMSAITPPRPYIVSPAPPAHLLRRLGAVCYDSLLLVAVLFTAGLPLPLIPEAVRVGPWGRYAILLYMVLVSFLFFGWFWTHGGQTLGMRAWRIRVVSDSGAGLTWRQAGRRFTWAAVSWAAAGTGFLWSLIDPQGRTWHDRLSGTRLVRTSLASQEDRPDTEEQQGR